MYLNKSYPQFYRQIRAGTNQASEPLTTCARSLLMFLPDLNIPHWDEHIHDGKTMVGKKSISQKRVFERNKTTEVEDPADGSNRDDCYRINACKGRSRVDRIAVPTGTQTVVKIRGGSHPPPRQRPPKRLDLSSRG